MNSNQSTHRAAPVKTTQAASVDCSTSRRQLNGSKALSSASTGSGIGVRSDCCHMPRNPSNPRVRVKPRILEVLSEYGPMSHRLMHKLLPQFTPQQIIHALEGMRSRGEIVTVTPMSYQVGRRGAMPAICGLPEHAPKRVTLANMWR